MRDIVKTVTVYDVMRAVNKEEAEEIMRLSTEVINNMQNQLTLVELKNAGIVK